MTLQERLLAFIASKQITVAKFETMIGVCNGYVRGVKDVIGSDKLVKIHERFPNLSLAWLLSEIGPMELKDDTLTLHSINNVQTGMNSFNSNVDYKNLLFELRKRDEEVDRLIKMLEHIVYNGKLD